MPTHALGFPVWAAIRGDAACVMLLEMNGAGIGHEGLYVTSLIERAMGWRKRADEFADTLKIASIFSRHTLDRYGGHFYAKAQNLRRRVRAGYDAVLASHDLLLLPTVPMKEFPARTQPRRRSRAAVGSRPATPVRSTSPGTRRSACPAGWRTAVPSGSCWSAAITPRRRSIAPPRRSSARATGRDSDAPGTSRGVAAPALYPAGEGTMEIARPSSKLV